jgi:uncharacterized membrane protein
LLRRFIELKDDQSSMSSESNQRSEPTARARRAFSWWSWIAIACVACGGSAATEQSPDGAPSVAGGSSSSGPSWCEIQAILAAKCQRCHQRPALHGAPFALLTYADTQVRDSKGRARFEQIADAVGSEYMPPQFIELAPAVALLTTDERATLLAWCAQGALLGGSSTCPNDP